MLIQSDLILYKNLDFNIMSLGYLVCAVVVVSIYSTKCEEIAMTIRIDIGKMDDAGEISMRPIIPLSSC